MPRNLITREMTALLRADFEARQTGHMREWSAQAEQRKLMILVARQIGSRWHFTRDALLTALEHGRNQFFILGDRSNVLAESDHVIRWVREVTGVKLVAQMNGQFIQIERGEGLDPVVIQFRVGINWIAAGWRGDVTVPDFFWQQDPVGIFNFAQGLAWMRENRVVFYSAIDVRETGKPARALWQGEVGAWLRKIEADFDFSHEALRHGKLGGDGIWRQIVTIDDVIAGGMDLYRREDLEATYGGQFAALFLCQFPDQVKEGQHHA